MALEYGCDETLLKSNSSPRSFSVILEAYDLVTMTDKRLIDRAVHRSVFRPTINSIGQSTDWHHVTITTQLSGYTFSMRLTCQPDHYNDTCAKVCLKNSSQYTCDANGDKICEPGWSGTECDRDALSVGMVRTVMNASSILAVNTEPAMTLPSPVVVCRTGEGPSVTKGWHRVRGIRANEADVYLKMRLLTSVNVNPVGEVTIVKQDLLPATSRPSSRSRWTMARPVARAVRSLSTVGFDDVLRLCGAVPLTVGIIDRPGRPSSFAYRVSFVGPIQLDDGSSGCKCCP
ncbi:uncharacterized protein DEA37_0000503 [Paragonimus westermani]|uniref:Delta-like protein n=1 Tax=Paragonimus westermani TaxID=34504 RepID=A0A5J4NRR5_9TREM|nr:uncharacterized protein DEA37_0000503 [Paragonimus westermani]